MGSRITSLRDGYVILLLRGTRETEGVGKVELVCVGRLWRMGGECLLMLVWRSVRVEFIDKGGVGCLGIQGSYLTARKPPSDGRRMGWDRGQLYQEYLPSPSDRWIRLNIGAWYSRENCLV